MPIRELTDGEGRRWQVWDTVPAGTNGIAADSPTARFLAGGARRLREAGATPARPVPAPSLFTAGRERGWLTFAADGEKRRLSPIPDGWEGAAEPVLVAYLGRAEQVGFSPPLVTPISPRPKR